MGRHIGVDLHRTCFTTGTRLANGRTFVRDWKIGELPRFLRTLRPDDEVAVEMTTNTRVFHDAVAPQVARVAVVNTNQFRVIAQSVKKTDRNDAETLALYLSKGLLPEVRLKEKAQAELASLTQSRDLLVKQRTALKNKVNNLFAARGKNLARETMSSERGLKRILAEPLGPVAAVEVRILVEQIRGLNRGIGDLEEAIEAEGRKLDGYENLTSIKGIGPLGASILLTVIGDIGDFAEEGKLAAYFGIVPRVSNSNETERSGRITKRGTKLGRTTLVQCALIAKRYSPYLHRYHERIKRKRGGGRANIALARKFLGVIYRTLKNRWVFEDFPAFRLKRSA